MIAGGWQIGGEGMAEKSEAVETCPYCGEKKNEGL